MKRNENPLLTLQESHASRVKRFGKAATEQLEKETRPSLTIMKFNKEDLKTRGTRYDDLFKWADRKRDALKSNATLRKNVEKSIKKAKNKKLAGKAISKLLK